MANSAFFLTSCIREKMKRKDPNVPDESWSWRGTDLIAQGKLKNTKLLDWQTVQRAKPGAPIFYAPDAAHAGTVTSMGRDVYFAADQGMSLRWGSLPQPIKDEYYLRLNFNYYRASPVGVKHCIFNLRLPDESPYDQCAIYVESVGEPDKNGNYQAQVSVVHFDTRGGTDPNNGWAGRTETFFTGKIQTNASTSIKLFFDSTGYNWETESQYVVNKGRCETGYPLYKPKGAVAANLNWDGNTYTGLLMYWVNIGMGNNIATAPPYP